MEDIEAPAEDEQPTDKEDLLPSQIEIPQEVEEMIEALPEDKKKEVKGMIVRMLIQESFKGPLPPPSILKGYEDVLPGSAERIMARMEKQSDHRMRLEEKVTAEDQRQSGKGQNYGFIIAITVILISAGLIFTGHGVEGTILGTLDLVALVSIFVIGKFQQRKD